MQKQLYPKEIIDTTVEAYLPTVSVKSQLIYSTIILVLLATFAALPFVFIDVSIQANGIIRTIAEKTEIKSLVSGRINNVAVAENQVVRQGDVLFEIAADELDTKLQLAAFQSKEQNQRVADLRVLLNVQKGNLFGYHSTTSSLHTQQLNTLRSVVQENLFAQRKIQEELQSDRRLYQESVISKRELDAKTYELTKLQAEYESIFQRQKSQWQADLNQLRLETEQTTSEKRSVSQQKRFYAIKAPVAGTILQVAGKYEGSFMQTGETLAVISPDSSLLVECYVSPQDIGLLKADMPVNFQIDAFNYNEWGLVAGKVIDIANDFVLINEQPVFKVKCALISQTVSLPTGYTANLKKGMTLRGRFVVAKRSLYQLLYDKVDDWVNPKVK